VKLSATPPDYRISPPVLGAHSDEVLAEAGLSAAEIAALREKGVV
jgi:crotonobetainyl-CoA:carnitine CoA-transferase CaiB-like acyl-CoA transferase